MWQSRSSSRPSSGFPLLAVGAGPWPEIGAALLGLALGAEIDLIAFLTTHYLGQGLSARSTAISSRTSLWGRV
jgi:hypothetical protein